MWEGGGCSSANNYDAREIDILEFDGSMPQNYGNLNGNPNIFGASTGNLHYCEDETYAKCNTPLDNIFSPCNNNNPNTSAASCVKGGQCYSYIIPNQDQWHVYGAYWEKGESSLLLDGFWHNTRKSGLSFGKSMSVLDGVRINYNEAYLIDNPAKQNTFPYTYQTDYIRIWKLHNDCNTEIIDIPNFNTYNYALKKSILLTEATQVPQNNPSQVISLRASDFIEFTDGFEVLDKREISFNTNECPD